MQGGWVHPNRTPWLKLLGAAWLLTGALGLVWCASGLPFVPVRAGTLLDVLMLSPWSQIASGVGALFCFTMGWGLVQRSSWVQTLAVPAHLLVIAYATVALIVVLLAPGRSAVWQAVGAALTSSLIVIHSGLALLMSGVRSTEALSWEPLRTSPAIPLTCEFCGSPLDPQTGQCPQCETVPEVVQRQIASLPPPAKLVGLADGSEYWIDATKKTLIGRGVSGNDISLSNPTVSRRHAQIEYRQGHYLLTALQDSNGTFVNETLIRQRTLQDGDELRFGRASFRFTMLEPGGEGR